MDEGNFKFKLILVKFKNTKYKEKILKTSREKSELVKSLNTSLLSGMVRYFSLYPYVSYPRPGVSPFSKELWFLLIVNVFRNKDTLGIHCMCSIVASRLFQWIEPVGRG